MKFGVTREPASSASLVLEARNLTYGYELSTLVIEEWSAQFHAGTMTAITGESGRGKSTLLYILGLMLNPSSGDVLVDGRSATTEREAERAHRRAAEFGFVFQDAALDATRSVIDNVTEVALYSGHRRDVMRDRAIELLETFEVNVPATRKPGQISGGQAQRIALCRALLTNPRIVLADEPTGNLDPATTQVVVDALRAHADSGAAVIIVTHSTDVARACDREIRL